MTTDETDKTEEGPRSFSLLLQQVADGDAHAELSQSLHELTLGLAVAARATAGVVKGELMLRLRMTVDEKGVVGVGYEVKIKEPPPTRSSSVFWITKGGNLTPENPRQANLFPRDVTKQEEAKDVGTDEQDARSV